MTTLTPTHCARNFTDGSYQFISTLKRELTCCFSGHRDIPGYRVERLNFEVESQIMFLSGKGIKTFLAGGALGFDTLAASAVLRIRDAHPELQLRLVLVLPCATQADRWSDIDKALYDEIKDRADGVITLFEKYTPDCMHIRNTYMVDNSIVCVAYMTRRVKSGTSHTINYCRRQGVMTVIFN